MQPDARTLRAFFSQAQRRIAWLSALRTVAIALGIALVTSIVVAAAAPGHAFTVSVVLMLMAVAAGVAFAVLRKRDTAALVEQRVHSHNLLLTAAELLDQRVHTSPQVAELVLARAARHAAEVRLNAAFPARRAVTLFLLTVGVCAASMVLLAARPAAPRSIARVLSGADGPAIDLLEVTIVPPAYTGEAARTLRDPARINALSGSRIRLAIHGRASTVTVETVEEKKTLRGAVLTTELMALRDGFIAVEPLDSAGRPGMRRLIGLTVTPDRTPRVRITAPGRDLFLADARRSIELAVEADDDRALAALVLRYTKVSGSGEQFSFIDGEIPLAVTRTDARNWRARGTIALDKLGLVAGDLVVYRAVATDQAPGQRATESDAYFIELNAPGSAPAEGFSADEEEKYALSQQMVILKTERLIARAPRMAAESLAYEAQRLAAEQRSVRAEFVFMMGGELAEEVLQQAELTELNEEAHAEADDEVLQGRLANQGRTALLQAIRAMSRANTALNAQDLQRALRDERIALDQLQRAFSRTRYILRALTQRERLDLSRRLTGNTGDVTSASRPAREPAIDPRVEQLRQALAGIAGLSADRRGGPGAARQASLLGQAVLKSDLQSAPAREIALVLEQAGTAFGEQRAEDARLLLTRALAALTELLRPALSPAPAETTSIERAQLQGALTDALRRLRPQ